MNTSSIPEVLYDKAYYKKMYGMWDEKKAIAKGCAWEHLKEAKKTVVGWRRQPTTNLQK